MFKYFEMQSFIITLLSPFFVTCRDLLSHHVVLVVIGFVECLLCTRHYAKYFTCIISLNLHNSAL